MLAGCFPAPAGYLAQVPVGVPRPLAHEMASLYEPIKTEGTPTL